MGGRPTVVANYAIGMGGRVAPLGFGDEGQYIVIANLAPSTTYYSYRTSPSTSTGLPWDDGWVAHRSDGQGVLLVKVGVYPHNGGILNDTGLCYAGGGGPGSDITLSGMLGVSGPPNVYQQYLMNLLGLTVGSAMDHGASLLVGDTVFLERVPVGSLQCPGHNLVVTLTPTMVAPSGNAVAPSSCGGVTCDDTNGGWSPLGTYTLNLTGTVMYS